MDGRAVTTALTSIRAPGAPVLLAATYGQPTTTAPRPFAHAHPYTQPGMPAAHHSPPPPRRRASFRFPSASRSPRRGRPGRRSPSGRQRRRHAPLVQLRRPGRQRGCKRPAGGGSQLLYQVFNVGWCKCPSRVKACKWPAGWGAGSRRTLEGGIGSAPCAGRVRVATEASYLSCVCAVAPLRPHRCVRTAGRRYVQYSCQEPAPCAALLTAFDSSARLLCPGSSLQTCAPLAPCSRPRPPSRPALGGFLSLGHPPTALPLTPPALLVALVAPGRRPPAAPRACCAAASAP